MEQGIMPICDLPACQYGSTLLPNSPPQGWDFPVGIDRFSGVQNGQNTCFPSQLATCRSPHQTVSSTSQQQPNSRKKLSRKNGGKSVYKHIPHREKPPHLVARRNARERRRVQAVNNAFARLRKCVPVENKSKRLSKVKTLHRAIEYIAALQEMLEEAETVQTSPMDPLQSLDDLLDAAEVETVNKENDASQRWITLENTCGQESYNPYMTFYEDYGSTLHS
ncbi:fer3-like protein [Limulus polyphemus]|uniref:Fer3-like protein n=1 Tax=Limulus polyphemus TaxID=6850 RepID=A0ABM1BTS7_LIMPO|nr:fer3-like protein [Limulus polyphemus]